MFEFEVFSDDENQNINFMNLRTPLLPPTQSRLENRIKCHDHSLSEKPRMPPTHITSERLDYQRVLPDRPPSPQDPQDQVFCVFHSPLSFSK